MDKAVIICGEWGDDVKLKARTMKDGRRALYLEYYLGYEKTGTDGMQTKVSAKRRKVALGLYYQDPPKGGIERQQKRQTLEEAREIWIKEVKNMKGQEPASYVNSRWAGSGDLLEVYRKNIYKYFDYFIKHYDKTDIRNIELSIRRFKEYTSAKRPIIANCLPSNAITPDIIKDFVSWLRENWEGTGPASAYKRFKKVIHQAVNDSIIDRNPCDGISCPEGQPLNNDVLSPDEVTRLYNTRPDGQHEENTEIRRAAILSINTGIRHEDIRLLTYRNIDYGNQMIRFSQKKVKGSSHEFQQIPVRADILNMIGAAPENKDEKLFKLPSHSYCNRYLKIWLQAAGIDKNITWHKLRHTAGTMIQKATGNINTTKELLGHSRIRHTQRYTHATGEDVREGINDFPEIPDL